MNHDDFWLEEPSWEELDSAPQADRPSVRSLAPIWIVFLLFIGGVLYLSFETSPFQPSMELRQISLARAYARAQGILIQDSLQTYPYGAVSAQPPLYSLIMGKLLLLSNSELSNLRYLRLFNIPLALLYFLALYAFIYVASPSRSIRAVFMVIMSTLSWPMLSFGSVSQHNIDFLMTALFFLFCARFFSKFSVLALLSILATLFVGSLNNPYFLSLLFCTLLVSLIYWKRLVRALFSEPLEPQALGLALVTLFLFAANLLFYGQNLIKHRMLVPSPDLVLGRDIAYRYVPSYRTRQDLVIRSTTTPAPSPASHAKDYAQSLVQQILSGRATGEGKFSSLDYAVFATIFVPGCVGLFLAIVRFRGKKKFGGDGGGSEEQSVAFPIALICLFYAILFVTQDLMDYSLIEVVVFDPLDSRIFPLAMGTVYLLSYFSLAFISRASLRILIIVLLVAGFAVESIPRTVLHAKSSPLNKELLNAG